MVLNAKNKHATLKMLVNTTINVLNMSATITMPNGADHPPASSILIMLVISIYITIIVYKEGIMIVEAGGWSAPFGIVIVADMFSTLMVVLTSILSVACLFFAFK